VLAANLRAALASDALAQYVPQARALALISTGDRYAIASWGRLSVAGRWVWRWKDWIDRRFMARYRSAEDGSTAS
jgi:selenide,water dikinase